MLSFNFRIKAAPWQAPLPGRKKKILAGKKLTKINIFYKIF
jgi:hypothetical protein